MRSSSGPGWLGARSLAEEIIRDLHLHVHCASKQTIMIIIWHWTGCMGKLLVRCNALSSGRWSISCSRAFSRCSNALLIWAASPSLDAADTSAVSCALSGRCEHGVGSRAGQHRFHVSTKGRERCTLASTINSLRASDHDANLRGHLRVRSEQRPGALGMGLRRVLTRPAGWRPGPSRGRAP